MKNHNSIFMNVTFYKLKMKNRKIIRRVTKTRQMKPEHAIRVICISDTHGKESRIPKNQIPECDVIICAGDITNFGQHDQMIQFRDWLLNQKCKERIIIAGNHDLSLDKIGITERRFDWALKGQSEIVPFTETKSIFEVPGIHYIENESIEVLGIRIFGTPSSIVSPPCRAISEEESESGRYGLWAFQHTLEDDLSKWSIPRGVDIVVSHSPPFGACDEADGISYGSHGLRKAIEESKPLLHVCGHVHSGYGISKIGPTTVANASILDNRRKVTHHPLIFDICSN